MVIKGGVSTFDKTVQLSISINGGKPYKKNFNDIVTTSMNKFSVLCSMLDKVLNTGCTERDINFYMNQIQRLFQRAHVQFIPGEKKFHHIYNMWLLDGYIKMLLETADIKLIAPLLNLDLIIFSIEESKRMDKSPIIIDFEVPSNIKVKKVKLEGSPSQKLLQNDDIDTYLHNVNSNLQLLNKFIHLNKEAFSQIYDEINKTAAKFI
jgi:hypothetical protein